MSASGKRPVAAQGGSGHTIEDEGTPLTARTKLNFVGAGVTVTDNPGADSSDVTISGTSASDASTTVKGVTKLTTAPASASAPIAVGDNDPRVTADQSAGTASIRTLGTGAAQAAPGNHAHTKADVGLSNVDNTSDANKPVSTAQATADALALAKASNLSDVANAGTARTNLGLGTAATTALDTDGTLAANSDLKVPSQKAVRTYVAANLGGGGGGPIESLYIPRIPATPATKPGRTWRADFSNQEAVNSLFDFTLIANGAGSPTSWAFTTDTDDLTGPGGSARAVVTPPSPYPAAGTILAKGCMVRDFEVAARFRVPADVHVSTGVQVLMRYLSANNELRAYKSFQPATPFVQVDHAQAGGTGSIVQSAATTIDATVSHIYKLKAKCVGNTVWAKCWVDGTVEPNWMAVGYMPGGSAWLELGAGGLFFQNVGGVSNVSELTVTELLPISDTVVFNGDFSIVEVSGGANNGKPLGWPLGTAPSGNSLMEFVDVVDASGSTRRFFHMRRPTLADGALGGLLQNIYSRDMLVGASISGLPMEWSEARKLEVGVTSKAVNIWHGAGNTFLGVAVDCYWLDETNTVGNTQVPYNSAGYYKVLGPHRASSDGTPANDGLDGTGTWDWRRDFVRVDVSGNGAQVPNRIDFLVTMHDTDILVDDFWMGDFYARPVA